MHRIHTICHTSCGACIRGAMAEAYDPLDYKNLAHSVVSALLEAPPTTLPPVESFTGSGVYALYYTGSLAFYSPLASSDIASTDLAWEKPFQLAREKAGVREIPRRALSYIDACVTTPSPLNK